jgi:hypothetical protein
VGHDLSLPESRPLGRRESAQVGAGGVGFVVAGAGREGAGGAGVGGERLCAKLTNSWCFLHTIVAAEGPAAPAHAR